MKAIPKAFEYDGRLRVAFEQACRCIWYYCCTRQEWKPPTNITVVEANYVYEQAVKLLNLN